MPEVWFDSVPETRFSRVRAVPQVGSTNADLMELARNGGAEGEVLIADFQSAGRGRRGRSWQAPTGTALMMSVLLRPPPGTLAPNQASVVVSAWACATAQACEAVTGVRPRLKWPNDLVVVEEAAAPAQPAAPAQSVTPAQPAAQPQHRKVAGILAESLMDGGAITALVIGMGLNTGWPEIPPELADTATSLNIVSGREVDRVELAANLLAGFEQRYAVLLGGAHDTAAHGVEQILAEVRQQSVTLGSRVRIEREPTPSGISDVLYGKAVDVNSDGTLLVVDDSGTHHHISVGDVVHLRASS